MFYLLVDVLQRRYTRVNSQGGSLYSGPGPEYDDPANCAPEEDQYGSQYGGPYGTPYDHYGSRGSMGRRSVGQYKKLFEFKKKNKFIQLFFWIYRLHSQSWQWIS